MLIAQTQDFAAWGQAIVQLVTAGGFGALVWYLMVKYVPSIEERHLVERTAMEEKNKAERAEFLGYIQSRDDQVQRQNDRFDALVKENTTAFLTLRDELREYRRQHSN